MPWYRTSSWSVNDKYVHATCVLQILMSVVLALMVVLRLVLIRMVHSIECGCPTGYTLGADFRECMGK